MKAPAQCYLPGAVIRTLEVPMPETLADLAPTLPGAGRHFVYFLNARMPGVEPEEDYVHVYIGVTSNLSARMRAHSRKWWAAALDIDLCWFAEHPTREAANVMEAREIAECRPEMNRAGRLALVVPFT